MFNQKGFFCYTCDLLHAHEYWCGVNEQALSTTRGVLSNRQYERN